MTTIVNALAEMRNTHGEGHGRAASPRGLEVRHGQLAVDAAAAYSRYVASIISDLGLA
ncbi:MAG: abortive infection family protein [Acidimicrobiales bacterium]|jgi:Cys-tRNA synthase (O-phospho-L-seryl-tRNA:Cys-tRNA synthase)